MNIAQLIIFAVIYLAIASIAPAIAYALKSSHRGAIAGTSYLASWIPFVVITCIVWAVLNKLNDVRKARKVVRA